MQVPLKAGHGNSPTPSDFDTWRELTRPTESIKGVGVKTDSRCGNRNGYEINGALSIRIRVSRRDYGHGGTSRFPEAMLKPGSSFHDGR